MGSNHTLIAACIVAVAASTSPALAQTRAGPPPAPPATATQATQTAPAMPVPASVVEQTRDQLEGDYGNLKRPRTSGQIQRAWDKSEDDAAVYVTAMCESCTYKVRLREYMVSVLELPRGEVIDAVDLGDKTGFSVRQRGPRRLALRAVGHGYDTNMLVYGRSGHVYPVYLRAEGFNSENVPDVVVRIEGSVMLDDDPDVSGLGHDDDERKATALPPMDTPFPGEATDALQGLTETNPGTPAGDFVAEAAFDPDALRGWGEYELSGSDELRPETVFRDDRFTYVKFGKRWNDVELPTAYVVVDGIDELVNTRVQGETYIIESTRPLITLKSGMSYLCIKYPGDDA
ncbi:MAG: TrbG/VirB9 family P-type conjugative transfer protein [Rhodospirillales bacterium]